MSTNDEKIKALQSLGVSISFAKTRLQAGPDDQDFLRAYGLGRYPSDPEIITEARIARAKVMQTGYDVPDGWLTVNLVRRAPDNVLALDRVCQEIGAAILRLEVGAGANPPKVHGEPPQAETRSAPMSKAELARRIHHRLGARERDVQWELYDLQPYGRTGKKWTVKLDGLPNGERQRLEAPR